MRCWTTTRRPPIATSTAPSASQSQQGTHPSPCTFVGAQNYYRESELELYYAGARYYDPAAGRWLSEDPHRIRRPGM